jgi:hypothetical protein
VAEDGAGERLVAKELRGGIVGDGLLLVRGSGRTYRGGCGERRGAVERRRRAREAGVVRTCGAQDIRAGEERMAAASVLLFPSQLALQLKCDAANPLATRCRRSSPRLHPRTLFQMAATVTAIGRMRLPTMTRVSPAYAVGHENTADTNANSCRYTQRNSPRLKAPRLRWKSMAISTAAAAGAARLERSSGAARSRSAAIAPATAAIFAQLCA